MTLKRLGHIAVRVNDIEKAIEFYTRLGLTNVWQDPDWAYMKAGSDGLALLGPGYRSAGAHFGFLFEDRADLKAEHERLQQAGIAVGSIHDHRDGTASFYGKDPDGNLFEFLYEPPQGVVQTKLI
ncbi:MAG: VOC family protein [Cyanobacteriota bacterium]|nr:VOC family protein [Cyanobacteriota bacterium]